MKLHSLELLLIYRLMFNGLLKIEVGISKCIEIELHPMVTLTEDRQPMTNNPQPTRRTTEYQ